MQLIFRTILISIVFFTCKSCIAIDNYVSGHASAQEALIYAKAKEVSTRYLIKRDITPWLAKVPGKMALDFGSGLGYSAEFLSEQKFEVVGVDINEHMVIKAQQAYPQIKFQLINKNELPFPNKSFDLVYSSLVLFEIESQQSLQKYLTESARVLKDNGYLIAITGSTHMADRNYKSQLRNTNYPENDSPKSGSIIKITLNEIGLTFSDYYWTEEDYRTAFKNAGFDLLQVHYPLGRDNEGYAWGDEKTRSPLMCFLAQKRKNN